MFENTHSAIDQLIVNIREAIDNGEEAVREMIDDMSPQELRAFRNMHALLSDLSNELSIVEEIE